MSKILREKLISLKDKDDALRNEILKRGGLYDGYDEEMEALHIANAAILKEIIDESGWPGKSLVEKDGATAAFWVAQHAISAPELQKFFLAELKKAVANGEATKVQEACLEDRILFNEGKPCKYGMLFDWDDDGNLVANVDDEKLVNERRAKLGLKSLSEALAKHREEIDSEGGGPPKDLQKHKQMGEAWAKRVGWR